jgi:hypothetical protein
LAWRRPYRSEIASKKVLIDTLKQRAGEVDAALRLGMSERDSRMEIIGTTPANAVLPNLDSTRTAGLVTLPGAFVGVLLSTGSAAQAGAVQILVSRRLLPRNAPPWRYSTTRCVPSRRSHAAVIGFRLWPWPRCCVALPL